MDQKVKKLENCLCCGGDLLTTVLDLGSQPLANSYPRTAVEVEDYYPLALNYCQNCSHLQLTHAVDPDLLFKHYLYVSGTTKTLRDYFEQFVQIVEGYVDRKRLAVLDIACNDGSQLDAFKAAGHATYGIDPAQNLYPISSANHKISCNYFSSDAVAELNCRMFDAIIAQNVVAHNTYPKEFLKTCAAHLAPGGRVFVQTSQANMVEYGQFDTIYHEHISFFNVKSMNSLVQGTGLYLQDVLKTDIHGTSYVFILSTNPGDDNSVKLIQEDYAVTPAAVEAFAAKALKVVGDLKEILLKYPDAVKIGYGAAAKGNTLLNFGSISLDCIVDDNPLKHSLYTPGRKIRIVSIDTAIGEVEDSQVVWIPLSWNFYNEIKSRVKTKFGRRSTFIKYFPELGVEVE